MGVHERDYWRDHQRQQRRTAAAPLQGIASKTYAWPLWIGLSVALIFGAKVLGEWRRSEPFPMTGHVHWYVAQPPGPSAPLTLQAPAQGAANFVVKLDAWESHAPVALVPVRSGEAATVQLPLGRYRVTIVKGLMWQGPSRMFGFNSEAREAVHPLDMYRVGNTTMGHRILLESFAGNMETRPARHL
jgi:hypothetical protein